MEKCFRWGLESTQCSCDSWVVKVPVKVTAYEIDCIIDSAMYGCSFWCGNVDALGTMEELELAGVTTLSEALTKGFNLLFEDEEGEEFELTIEKMLKGIELFCASGRNLDDVDAGQADSIIQLALFGEEIYG